MEENVDIMKHAVESAEKCLGNHLEGYASLRRSINNTILYGVTASGAIFGFSTAHWGTAHGWGALLTGIYLVVIAIIFARKHYGAENIPNPGTEPENIDLNKASEIKQSTYYHYYLERLQGKIDAVSDLNTTKGASYNCMVTLFIWAPLVFAALSFLSSLFLKSPVA